MTVDHFTHTLADAASFEARRVGGGREAGVDPAEAWDDPAIQRIERQREDAARARGEYVPDNAAKRTWFCLSVTLAQAGIFGSLVTPTREGVFRIENVQPAAAANALLNSYPDIETSPDGDSALWVRTEPLA